MRPGPLRIAHSRPKEGLPLRLSSERRFLVAVLAVASPLFATSAVAHASIEKSPKAGELSAAAAVAPAATRASSLSATSRPAPRPMVSRRYHALIADTGADIESAAAGARRSSASVPQATGGRTRDSRAESLASADSRNEPLRVRTTLASARAHSVTRLSPRLATGVVLHSPVLWYRAGYSRYQLPITISKLSHTLVREVSRRSSGHMFARTSQVQPVTGHRISSRIQTSTAHEIDDQNARTAVIPVPDRAEQGPAEPRSPAADTRMLLELGLGLGFAYVAFLACWFWKTRDRPHGVGRVVRF